MSASGQGALRRLRGALGMGVTWALAWGIIGGGIMEGIVDPDGRILDMWPQTLAIPGFVGGVAFSLLLWATHGRRGFHELSLSRFGGLGAAVGALLGGAAIAAGTARDALPLGLRLLVLAGPAAALGAVSAGGILMVARVAGRRGELPAHGEAGAPGAGEE